MANTTPKSASSGKSTQPAGGRQYAHSRFGEEVRVPRGSSANHASHSECTVNWREPVISAEPSYGVRAEQYSVQSCQETGRITGSRTTPYY